MLQQEVNTGQVASDDDVLTAVLNETADSILSVAERDDFDTLDTAIRKHVSGFKALGMYLDEVRQRRLYREQYGTFEAYLDNVGLKRQRAYELIEAAAIAKSVSEISDIAVTKDATPRAAVTSISSR